MFYLFSGADRHLSLPDAAMQGFFLFPQLLIQYLYADYENRGRNETHGCIQF